MSVANIRIAGVNLPPQKHLVIALTSIYGIGTSTAKKICTATKINPEKKVATLSNDEEELLRKEVQNYEIEGELRRNLSMAIKRIIDLKCFRGLRHIKKLPCRGQRTKTNARTRKGRKRIPKEAKS